MGQYLVDLLVRLRYTHVTDSYDDAMSEALWRIHNIRLKDLGRLDVQRVDLQWAPVTSAETATGGPIETDK